MTRSSLVRPAIGVLVVAAITHLAVVLPSGRISVDGTGLDHVVANALAFSVTLLCLPVAWLMGLRRQRPTLALGIVGIGVSTALGSLRFGSAPRLATGIVIAFWLVGAAGGLTAIVAGQDGEARVTRQRLVVMVGPIVISALITAVADWGAGLRATFGPGASTPTAAAGAALAAHLGCVAAAAGWWVLRRRGGWSLPDALAGVWLSVAIWERGAHLLDAELFRDEFRNTYLPWALVLVVRTPLAVTVALVSVLGWTHRLPSPARRTSTGEVTIDVADPIESARADLAAWLGDPTLQIRYRFEDVAQYDRAMTVLSSHGRTVGFLEHDLGLLRSPEALVASASLAATGLEANALLALSRSRLREAGKLSERLLVADVTMRAEVMAEIERGPVADLRACAEALADGTSLHEVAERLRTVTAEVRRLSHGFYPPELLDEGLASILPGRVGAPGRPLPASLQVTAYLLAMDDPHAWFEECGTILRVHRAVSLTRTSLIDRVTVLGGDPNVLVIDLPIGDA